jgi:hypothetical protein
MAGTEAMGNWWHQLTDAEHSGWCDVLAGKADVTEAMLDTVDESCVGVVEDMWGGHPGWQRDWDAYWLINSITLIYPWALNPDFQAFLHERCHP